MVTKRSTKREAERRALLDNKISPDAKRAGANYYSEADIDRVIRALPGSPQGQRQQLQRDLEMWAVNFFWRVAWDLLVDTPPSVSARGLAALGSRLDDVLTKLQDLTPLALDDLNEKLLDTQDRFHGLAKHLRAQSRFDNSEPTEIWGNPAEFVAEVQETIRWFREAVHRSHGQYLFEKGEVGGNRPDRAKHIFCQNLVFCQNLARWINNNVTGGQLSAWTNRISDETEGPLADLLEACFRPLGLKDSRAALVRTYRRATKTVPETGT